MIDRIRTSTRAAIVAVLFLVACAVILPSSAWGKPSPRTYRVAVFDYYPAIFRDADGRIRGFYVDMLDEISRREGITFEYVCGSWNESLDRARRGEVDLLTSVAWSDERAGYLDYCSVPLLTVWGELYQRKDAEPLKMTGLSGRRVGVMKGDFNGLKFRETVTKFGVRCEYEEYPGFAAVFQAIREKKVDAGVVSVLFGEASHERFGLVQTGIAFAPFDIFFAAPKGADTTLLRTLDRYLALWKDDPSSVYYAARLKWRSGRDDNAMPSWLRYALLAAVTVAVAATAFSLALRIRIRVVTRALLRKEDELRRERDFASLLLDSTSEGILGVGGDGRCVFCNRGFAALLGLDSVDQVIGLPVDAVVVIEDDPEGVTDVRDFFARVRGTGTREHIDSARVSRADGSTFVAEIWSWLMAFADGGSGTVLTMIDITSRVDAERSRAARAVAERANRAKSDFISRMSHELRTPLNSVIVLSGVLSRRLSDRLSEEEASYLSVVERNGRHLLEMINEILDLSRIESGRDETEFLVRDIAALVADCVASVGPQAAAKGLRLNLRPNEGPLLAVTDERKFRHVVLNILTNAVKYTREGSVTVSTRVDGSDGVIEIVDTGIGISPELLPRVFDEFMQAEGADMRQGGVGLGLAIAKRCATSIGGSIRVESSVGKGSSFTFSVPLGAVPSCPSAADGRERRDRSFGRRAMDFRRAGAAEAPNDGRKTILVIDDDPDGLLSASALLGDSFDIRSSSNGVEGVMLAGAFNPDLILLDLTMPGLSGVQTVELLRASPKTAKIPVIAVSASVVDPASLIASGFDAYMPKPIDGERLLEEIKGLL